MEIAKRNSYFNSICSAIIVNDDDSMDPEGLGRIQIYIPSIQTDESYFNTYPDYTASPDKENHAGWSMFPWAITLVDDLENGNVVYISNIDNENNSFIIIGLDVNNPANKKSSGGDLSGSLYGILDLAMPVIIHNEVGTDISAWPDNIPDRNYKKITPYDNGGWSIGLIQWHHARAFDCLYQIAKADANWESNFTDKNLDLYEDLKKSIQNNSSSAYRTKYQANYHPKEGQPNYVSIQNMLGSS